MLLRKPGGRSNFAREFRLQIILSLDVYRRRNRSRVSVHVLRRLTCNDRRVRLPPIIHEVPSARTGDMDEVLAGALVIHARILVVLKRVRTIMNARVTGEVHATGLITLVDRSGMCDVHVGSVGEEQVEEYVGVLGEALPRTAESREFRPRLSVLPGARPGETGAAGAALTV